MQSLALAPDAAPDLKPSTLPLLTPAESLFHACLESLTSQRCHIQCKPRLANVLQHESIAGFLKLCQRHIDFLICRKEDWQPMLAIEFDEDDGGADRLQRKMRDRLLVNDVLLATGVPLLQVHARELNQVETLVHKLSAAWQQRVAALAAEPPPTPAIDPNALPHLAETGALTTRLSKPLATARS